MSFCKRWGVHFFISLGAEYKLICLNSLVLKERSNPLYFCRLLDEGGAYSAK